MEVIESVAIQTKGPREEMQDVTTQVFAEDGTSYFGVFDGHDEMGRLVAAYAAEALEGIADVQFDLADSISVRAEWVGSAMLTLDEGIKEKRFPLLGGTTATVAILRENDLAVVYLGDSEAYYYPDENETVTLVNPHNANNASEVERVKGSGAALYGRSFGLKGTLATIEMTRAIGDLRFPFVIARAETSQLTLSSAGSLAIGSDGVFGDETRSLVQAEIRRDAKAMPHFRSLPAVIESCADQNQDNASLIVVRIE